MNRLPLAILLIGALPLLACTPPLTAEDARPFQGCAVDDDCSIDSLSCNGCGGVVPIAEAQRAAFEALRGCWETPIDALSSRCKGIVPSLPLTCVAGRCNFGRQPPPGPR